MKNNTLLNNIFLGIVTFFVIFLILLGFVGEIIITVQKQIVLYFDYKISTILKKYKRFKAPPDKSSP
jgi:hypothetical protein